MSGIKMIFSYFMIHINTMYVVCFSSIYIYICTYTCLILEKHWLTLISSWPDELYKVGQPEKNVLKKKYKTTDKLLNFCIQVMIILILYPV